MPPIAIIAGNGKLPGEIASALRAKGRAVYIFAIEGQADGDFTSYNNVTMELERTGSFFKKLKYHKIKEVVLAGGVIGRPEFTLKKMDWGTFITLPTLLSAHWSGDNAVLNNVIDIFEKRGFEVCNIAKLIPELAVAEGANTKLTAKKKAKVQIALGAQVCRTLGQFDIGQGCVVIGKRAVAVEGVEGTDAMLERVAELKKQGRLPTIRDGVLVKSLKPNQNKKADLPTIGPNTVQKIFEAGLVGIGVEANNTLIVERVKTIQTANNHGLFIFGYQGEE